MEIVAQCIAEAHERVCDAIIEEGAFTSIETEPGKWMNTWELTDPVMLIVRNPESEPRKSEACDFGDKFIRQYMNDILNVKQRGFVYEYPNRLFDYPWFETGTNEIDSMPYSEPHGNGNGEGIDQIAKIIEKLTNNPTNRRSLAITWVPELDADAVEPPCLQFTHFLMRKGVVAHGQDPDVWYLSGRFPFRSHDMLSGYSANALGLLGLMDYVMHEVYYNMMENDIENGKNVTDVRIGSLITWSSSAHIYCDAQSKELSKMTGLINTKKMSKTWWVP
jgi:thymidylate synthase